MQANELRVGNLVNINHEGIWQWRSDWFEIYFVDDNSDSESVLPIPLTEEWLMKFGLQETDKEFTSHFVLVGNGSQLRKKCARWITENLSGEMINQPFLRIDGITDVYYVHQLQNLFFALTGKELEIKTNAPQPLPG